MLERHWRALSGASSTRCYKVPLAHRWPLQMSLSDAAVRAASCRLEVQEAHGLTQVQAQVAGGGHTPDHCHCRLSGVPAALDRVPADLLYKRLCELGSLEMQVRDQMRRIADVLLEEGFLTITGTSDDEDEDDEQC